MPDQRAFERFATEHMAALLRTARLLTGSWEGGADLAQESLIRLYLAWPRLRSDAAAWAYLRRIMVRLHVRQSARRWSGELPTADLPESAVAEPEPYDVELMAALRALPSRQRATVVLRYFLDLSIEETARTLRCSTGTVKSQTSKGLEALRGLLVENRNEGCVDVEQ